MKRLRQLETDVCPFANLPEPKGGRWGAGLTADKMKEGRWIKTVPGKGWFVYFRIYGPGLPAFDGSWKPGDFEEMK